MLRSITPRYSLYKTLDQTRLVDWSKVWAIDDDGDIRVNGSNTISCEERYLELNTELWEKYLESLDGIHTV